MKIIDLKNEYLCFHTFSVRVGTVVVCFRRHQLLEVIFLYPVRADLLMVAVVGGVAVVVIQHEEVEAYPFDDPYNQFDVPLNQDDDNYYLHHLLDLHL